MSLFYIKNLSKNIQLYIKSIAEELSKKANINNPSFKGVATLDGIKIPTITQPIAYDIPLTDGFVRDIPCKYWITQDGELRVTLRVTYDINIQVGQTIAILPVGYRPVFTVSSNGIMYISDNGQYIPIHIDFNTDGEIKIFFNGPVSGKVLITIPTINALVAR